MVGLLAGTPPLHAQFNCDIYSSNQFNTNPNEVANSDASGVNLSTFVGQQSLWLGYTFEPSANVRIAPSYSLAFTLWADAPDQNRIAHTFGLNYRQSNLKLFGYREPEAGPAVETGDTAKGRMVGMLDAVADLLDSTVYTRRASAPATAPGPADTKPTADEPSDDDDDIDELDLLGDDDLDEDAVDTATVESAPAAPAGDPLLGVMDASVERLDALSDTLDVFSGSRELVDHTADGVRQVVASLAPFQSDPVAAEATRRLNALLRSLAAYRAPADADDNIDVDADDEDFLESAPVSITRQPLLRNTSDDYYFYTSSDDAGGDYLSVNGGASIGRYYHTTDSALLQYNNTSYYATALLEQRLTSTWSVWGSYTLSADVYPAADVFNNVEHQFNAQLRYVPTSSLLVAVGAGYGIRRYSVSQLGTTTGSGTDAETRVIAEGQSSTLWTLDAGVFGRFGANTMVGGIIGVQSTPTLSPRMTVGSSGGRLRLFNQDGTNPADNPFNWHGAAFQLVAMQMLPGEIVATAHVSIEGRNFGRPTVVTARGNLTLQKDRFDDYATVRLSFARDFPLNDAATSFLSLQLSAGLIRNTSTNYQRANGTKAFADNSFRERYAELSISWDPF